MRDLFVLHGFLTFATTASQPMRSRQDFQILQHRRMPLIGHVQLQIVVDLHADVVVSLHVAVHALDHVMTGGAERHQLLSGRRPAAASARTEERRVAISSVACG